jgi:hypothetical protein
MSNGLALFAKKYTTRVGDGYGIADIVKAAAGVAEAGINVAQSEQKQSASAADTAAKLSAVLIADDAATHAVAQAAWSTQLAAAAPGNVAAASKAAADQAAAINAVAAQDAAGAVLPIDGIPKRVDAARKALDKATSDWQTATRTKDQAGASYDKALVDAARATLNKASNQQIVNRIPDDHKPPEESWFTTPVIGPVKPWHVLLATVAGGVGLLALRK